MDAEHVFWQLTDINKRITRFENILEPLPILLVAQAHPTHVSVESAATILGVSPKTVRRRIRRRELKLEGAYWNAAHRHPDRAARGRMA